MSNIEGVSEQMSERDVNENIGLRDRSDNVHCSSALVSFLYELMRDHMPPGEVEKLVRNANGQPTSYTNGWLAQYASDLAQRLDPPPGPHYHEIRR